MSQAFRLLLLLSLCACVFGCQSGPTNYESSSLNNDADRTAAADKYWKTDGWGGVNPKHARKAAIVEFNVEYMTSESANMDRWGTSSIGGIALKAAEMSGAFRKTFQYEEQFMDDFTLDLYDQCVKSLEAKGFTIVPRETLQADPEFVKIAGSDDDKGTRQTSRLQRNTGIIVNAPGFPRQNVGFFASNAIANARTLPALAHNVDAEMALSVFIRLGMTKEGKAVIAEGSQIKVFSDLVEHNMPAGKQYYFNKQTSMTSKQGMFAGTATTTRAGSAFGKGKIMEVDSDSFRSGVMTMYPAYIEMAGEKLK